MTIRTNRQRAERAERALLEYNGADSRDDGVAGQEEMLSDMLGDLRHYCRLNALDFERCNARGQDMARMEAEEDSDD